MPSRSERERRDIRNSGSAINRHSTNQKKLKVSREGEEKVFGDGRKSKASKAEQRKKSQQDFIREGMPLEQFKRAVSHIVIDKSATFEEIEYILRHIDFVNKIEGPYLSEIEIFKGIREVMDEALFRS